MPHKGNGTEGTRTNVENLVRSRRCRPASAGLPMQGVYDRQEDLPLAIISRNTQIQSLSF